MIKKILKKAAQILLILLAVCIALFLILVVYVVIDDKKQAEEERVARKFYTYEQLQEFSREGSIPIGVKFWDEFKAYEHLYNLDEIESQILGHWEEMVVPAGLEPTYVFYPNHLFITSRQMAIDKKNGHASFEMGTWYIRNGILYVQMHGFMYWIDERRVFEPYEPQEYELIDVNDLSPLGYSIGPVAAIPFGQSNYKLKLYGKNYPKFWHPTPCRRYKSIYTLPGPYAGIDLTPGKHYGWLSIFPAMAETGMSAEELFIHSDVLEKLFSEVFW